MLEKAFDVIAPHRCSACGEKGALFCDNCKNDIISEPWHNCIFCLKPALSGVCPSCMRHSGYRQGWCLGMREDGLKYLGDQYKFDCKRAGSSAFVDMLDTVIPLLPPDIALLSVPTTSSSVRVRGFDHVGRVAKEFAERRKLAVVTPLVRSTNLSLHFLDFSARTELAESLFQLSGSRVPKRVLVMDDIITTGTTLRAVSKLLRTAGVEELYAVVWARQPKD